MRKKIVIVPIRARKGEVSRCCEGGINRDINTDNADIDDIGVGELWFPINVIGRKTTGYFLWRNIKETENDSPNKGYNVTFVVS